MNYTLGSKRNPLIFRVSNLSIGNINRVNIKEYNCKKLTFSSKNNEYGKSVNHEDSKKRRDENNTNFFQNPKYKIINSQPKRNLSVFGYNRGKLFISIKKDFTSFVVNSLIIFVFLYSIYTLAPNETISQRRKRIITERLMKEYDISERDLEMIEHLDEITEK
ncbi:hypothetical protein MKS88_001819 [Plasmodium brasilianum]|uniref:Uncharacterized protein n=2 Tax=Plasmodium (Plasmodium) TaxID=418103 RepID=A0A1A8XAR3_PLAMA|nr:conserved protein, unknown function [Plasmodium malariae]KAI4839273.1 hypothetical protein MKS88_001819 [Plasmodium brasilianum]SBT00910.1 conserved protein, unknown function [Plasmodium malariae]SBT87684.1 conserved protein, unknown function [Plasmodium malariae]